MLYILQFPQVFLSLNLTHEIAILDELHESVHNQQLPMLRRLQLFGDLIVV